MGTPFNFSQSLILQAVFTGKIVEIPRKENLMPRRILFLVLFMALALAACKSNSQAGTVNPATGKTPETTAGATTVPKQASTLSLPAQPSVAGCTVVSFLPTPDPTSLFPPASADDWYRGPLTATIKIIEYSDFQ